MERIIIVNRSTKTDGTIKLRFRLMDSGKLELFYSPGDKVPVKDLSKFEPTGELKPKVTVYNKELHATISKHIAAMHKAYEAMKQKGLDMTSAVFEEQIHSILNPIKETRANAGENIHDRFVRFAKSAHRDGVIGDARYKQFMVQMGKIERFLTIKGLSELTAQEFDSEILMQFRQFIMEEYKYVPRFKRIYKGMKKSAIPTEKLSINTLTSQLKIWQTFFNELESQDEIIKSPFKRLGTEKKKSIMHTMYDNPVFLRLDELKKLIEADVPEKYETTRDAFVLQCALGCRIGDFQRMSMKKVAVSPDGIPYVHYIPSKTAGSQETNSEIETPLVRYAFDIVKKTEFNLPILNYPYGVNGYNVKIKELLKICGVDREVKTFNEETRDNEYLPLYEAASTKLARKTHVDIMNKVQVNIYAAGLHRQGSAAVHRYTMMELADRFALMNVAFDQEDYRVNENLEVIFRDSSCHNSKSPH